MHSCVLSLCAIRNPGVAVRDLTNSGNTSSEGNAKGRSVPFKDTTTKAPCSNRHEHYQGATQHDGVILHLLHWCPRTRGPGLAVLRSIPNDRNTIRPVTRQGGQIPRRAIGCHVQGSADSIFQGHRTRGIDSRRSAERLHRTFRREADKVVHHSYAEGVFKSSDC